MTPYQGSIAFEAKRGPSPRHPAPKPVYRKGDTTAALTRLVDLRRKERLALKVDKSLIVPLEEFVSRWHSRATVEGILSSPDQPALSGDKPQVRPEIEAVVEPEERDVLALAMSPAVTAIVALCGCRWPIGEPSDEAFHFCNKKRAAHFYCEAHETESKK